MIPITPINAEAQDIIFEFEDSCNCCCFGGMNNRPNSKTQVYINSEGIAERFDPKKGHDEMRTLMRSMRHLNQTIKNNAFMANRNMIQFHFQVGLAVGSSLDEDDPVPLTIELIKKINTAIQEIFI